MLPSFVYVVVIIYYFELDIEQETLYFNREIRTQDKSNKNN